MANHKISSLLNSEAESFVQLARLAKILAFSPNDMVFYYPLYSDGFSQ